MKEIIFAGAGGQGVLTSGLILSEIAIHNKLNTTWVPEYGSAMRGGDANCTVKFGKERVYNPGREEADILLAMNQSSFDKFLPMVKAGGAVIVNTDMVDMSGAGRSDVTFIPIPCLSLANEIGNPRGANIIMTGAIVKACGDIPKQDAIDGMNAMFRRKGKEKFEASNTKAFEVGFDYEA